MPSSRRRKRQEPELVELTPGVHLDADADIPVLMHGGLGWYRVHLRTDPDERVPHLVDFCEHFAEPPAVIDIPDEHKRRIIEYAIAKRAAEIAADRAMAAAGARWATSSRIGDLYDIDVGDIPLGGGGMILDQDELDRVGERAVAAVRPKPGRRPVSDEEKLRILELYRTKGIAETMAITGKKERTVRRHIADARRIEQGER